MFIISYIDAVLNWDLGKTRKGFFQVVFQLVFLNPPVFSGSVK